MFIKSNFLFMDPKMAYHNRTLKSIFTMYIDAVKQEFAPTSRSKFRKSFSEYTLEEFFELRNNPNEYQKTKTSF